MEQRNCYPEFFKKATAMDFVLRSAAWGFLFAEWKVLAANIWFECNAELTGVGTHWIINKPRREGATEASCTLNIHNYRRTDHQGDF